MSYKSILILVVTYAVLNLAACTKDEKETAGLKSSANESVSNRADKIIVASEDVLRIQNNILNSGPVTTGHCEMKQLLYC
jgi:hypothetical protein